MVKEHLVERAPMWIEAWRKLPRGVVAKDGNEHVSEPCGQEFRAIACDLKIPRWEAGAIGAVLKGASKPDNNPVPC
jgi:hypothetical protein